MQANTSYVLSLLLLSVVGCGEKNDSQPTAEVKPVVSFAMQFEASGPASWSRNYTEAECSAPPIQDFTSQGILLSFKANPASGEECVVEVMGVSKDELLPGVVGTYDGDGVFKTELAFRPKNFQCYVPAVAYTNQHGTPYTFTITSYDAKTKRASGTFNLNLGRQANPALCPQQENGEVRVQGKFQNIVLPD